MPRYPAQKQRFNKVLVLGVYVRGSRLTSHFIMGSTLPKTNIEPKHTALEDVFPSHFVVDFRFSGSSQLVLRGGTTTPQNPTSTPRVVVVVVFTWLGLAGFDKFTSDSQDAI